MGQARPFKVAQVKHYLTPKLLFHAFFTDLERGSRHFKSPSQDFVFSTEVLHLDDNRTVGQEMTKCNKREIKNLLEKGMFEVILK